MLESLSTTPLELTSSLQSPDSSSRIKKKIAYQQNPERFAEWWEIYRKASVTLGRSPGGKQNAARSWQNLERKGIDTKLVFDATVWDINERLAKHQAKQFVPFLPNGNHYLSGGYWETALEQQKQQQEELAAKPTEGSQRQQIEQEIAELTQSDFSVKDRQLSKVYSWNGVIFRSKAEFCIAKALEQEGILFFPNAKCRLGEQQNRATRECDFLICHQGRWGVLEVDGEHWHQTAAKDHDRDRLFQQHGIHFIQRFDAVRCQQQPELVVRDVLALMTEFYKKLEGR